VSRATQPWSKNDPCLPLATLLFRSDDLEASIACRILLDCLFRSLLRNLRPSTLTSIYASWAARFAESARIELSFVGKLTSAQKLFGVMTTVDSIGYAVYSLGDDIDLRREGKKIGYKFLG